MIDTGRLKDAVRLERPTTIRNAYGEEVPSWETVAMVRAGVEPISSQERMKADQMQADLSHRIWIRYRPDVTAEMRFVLLPAAARTFHIAGPPRDRREGHELMELL